MPTPFPLVEKLSSMKPVPGAKKVETASLAFMFRSLIHFRLIIVYNMKKGSEFFLHVDIQLFQHHLLDTLNSIPLICVFILILVPYCFYYCSFISFEIGKCEFSNMAFLFQYCFAYFRFPAFPYEF